MAKWNEILGAGLMEAGSPGSYAKMQAGKQREKEQEGLQAYRKWQTKLGLQRLNVERGKGKYDALKTMMDIQGKAPKAWAWGEFQKYLEKGEKPPPEILKAIGMYLSPENLMMGEAMGFGGTLGGGGMGGGGAAPKMPKYDKKTEKLMYSPGQKKYFKVPK